MSSLCSHISCSSIGTQCNISKIEGDPCGAIDETKCNEMKGHYCEIKPVINLNKSHINFYNNTDKSLYLIFDHDPTVKDALNWKMSFNDINYVNIETDEILKTNYRKLRINPRQILYLKDFRAGPHKKPEWVAGSVRATFVNPIQSIDLKGMTVMEWTLKQTASAGLDISSVDGVNISCRLNIIRHKEDNTFELVNKSVCDSNHKNLIFNMNHCNNFKVDKNNITRCMNPTYNDNKQKNFLTSYDNIEKKTYNCGIHHNCGQCGTGPDRCLTGSKDTNICFAKNFYDRIGCHVFWESDPYAIQWKKLLKDGDVYSWAYDELRLQNFDNKKPLNISELVNNSWPNNKWYKCFKKEYNEDSTCNNYLVRNNKAPLVSCSNFDVNTTAVFTICEADGSQCVFTMPMVSLPAATPTPLPAATPTPPTPPTPPQTPPILPKPCQSNIPNQYILHNLLDSITKIFNDFSTKQKTIFLFILLIFYKIFY